MRRLEQANKFKLVLSIKAGFSFGESRTFECPLLALADIRTTTPNVRYWGECVAKLFLHPKQAILIQG
jgi:hypothetical protein